MSARRSLTGVSFTLLELVVVVAVILVLTALLLPVLGRAREKSVRVHCAANQRRLINALLTYAEDANGSLLPSHLLAASRPAVLHNDAARLVDFANQYLEGQYEFFDEPNWAGFFRFQKERIEDGQATGIGVPQIYTYGYLGAAALQQVRWSAGLQFDPQKHGLNPDAVARRVTAAGEWPVVADVACQALNMAGDEDPDAPPNWWIVGPHFAVGGGVHVFSRPALGRAYSCLGELAGGNHAYVDGRVEWVKKRYLDQVLRDGDKRLYYWQAAR